MFRHLKVSFLALAICGLLTAPSIAGAADHWGEPDPTFGSGGFSFIEEIEQDSDVLVQPDGKVLVAGIGDIGGAHYNAVIKRLLPNGAPDPSFGVNGVFGLAVSASTNDGFRQIALQPDGKILAVGSSQLVGPTIVTRGLLARINANGTLDTTTDSTPSDAFGADSSGYEIVQHEDENTRLDSLALDPSGVISVSGNYGTYAARHPLLRRYDSDGSASTSFNANALTALEDKLMLENGSVLAHVAADAKAHVIYTSQDGTQVHVLRFGADGTIDDTYANAGELLVEFDILALASDTLTAANGDLLITGSIIDYSTTPYSAIGTLMRIDTTGEFDETFGFDGLALINGAPWLDFNTAAKTVELPGGGLAVLGNASGDDFQAGNVSVLNADGQYNEAFGDFGSVDILPEISSVVNGLGAQSDGRILVSGDSYDGSNGEAFLARLRLPFADPPEPPKLTPPQHINPGSIINTPTGRPIRASGSKTMAGSATPKGGIARVAIAIQRVDSKALKRGKCKWLKNRDGKFKSVRASDRKCDSPPLWLSAVGTDSWSYKLKNRLAKGTYVLHSRATATNGTRQAIPTSRRFKVK